MCDPTGNGDWKAVAGGEGEGCLHFCRCGEIERCSIVSGWDEESLGKGWLGGIRRKESQRKTVKLRRDGRE